MTTFVVGSIDVDTVVVELTVRSYMVRLYLRPIRVS